MTAIHRRLRGLPAPVWAMALIYGVGGAMCMFSAAFPLSPQAPTTLGWTIGPGLLVGSAVILWIGEAMPPVGLQVAAFLGTLVNSVLVSQCATDYGATLNSFAYLWVAIYAGQFFELRAVRLQSAAIVVGSGVALELSGLPGMVTAWVLIAGSSALAGEALGRVHSRLRIQLITDPLTGLLNRAGFQAAAERVRAPAQRADLPVSIALIDLDGFKQVNDLKGHAAGDELLSDLGRAWGAGLEDSEVLARVGGDEFALVMPGVERGGVGAVLRRLRTGTPAAWSVGVVEWQPGESLDRAMARADEDLYRAKRARAGDEVGPWMSSSGTTARSTAA